MSTEYLFIYLFPDFSPISDKGKLHEKYLQVREWNIILMLEITWKACANAGQFWSAIIFKSVFITSTIRNGSRVAPIGRKNNWCDTISRIRRSLSWKPANFETFWEFRKKLRLLISEPIYFRVLRGYIHIHQLLHIIREDLWNVKQMINAISCFAVKSTYCFAVFLPEIEHTANGTTRYFIFTMKSINSWNREERKVHIGWHKKNLLKPRNYFEGWIRKRKINCNCS